MARKAAICVLTLCALLFVITTCTATSLWIDPLLRIFDAPRENAVDEPRTKDPEGAVTPAVTPPLYAKLRMFNAMVNDTFCQADT